MSDGHMYIDSTFSGSLSSLSSTSSLASLSSVVSVHDDVFKEAVDKLKTGLIPLQFLVETAVALINMIATHEEENVFEYTGSTLKLDAVLHAMLHHAEGCGGIGGMRYTASAICSCTVRDEPDESTLFMLHDLAKTWVSHSLFICECRIIEGWTKIKISSSIL